MFEYYDLRDVQVDDRNPDNEPSNFDFIQIAGEHRDLFISYSDVDQLIKLLRRGKRKLKKLYKQRAVLRAKLR